MLLDNVTVDSGRHSHPLMNVGMPHPYGTDHQRSGRTCCGGYTLGDRAAAEPLTHVASLVGVVGESMALDARPSSREVCVWLSGEVREVALAVCIATLQADPNWQRAPQLFHAVTGERIICGLAHDIRPVGMCEYVTRSVT